MTYFFPPHVVEAMSQFRTIMNSTHDLMCKSEGVRSKTCSYEPNFKAKTRARESCRLATSTLHKLNKCHVLFFFIGQVMESKGIPIENIHGFLDHLGDTYEGIDKEIRKKMDGIQWASEWSYNIMEFKYNAASDSYGQYGMIAFGKSEDGKFVDCMYCLYKLDFKVAPEKINTKKDHSVLWGLVKWQTVKEGVKGTVLGVKLLKRIKNFFRYQALEGFYRQGLIDQINVVPSIEDVVDEI